MNLPGRAPGVFTYSLNEIRLAMEAMSVPSPPTLVPVTRARPLSVNSDSIRAAGTLLTNWLTSAETSISLPSSSPYSSDRTALIRATLPTKIKKKQKVSSSA